MNSDIIMYECVRSGKSLNEIYSNSGGDYLLSGRRSYVGVNHKPHEVHINDWPIQITDNIEVGFYSDDIGMRWEFGEKDCLKKVVYKPGSVEYHRVFEWLHINQIYFVPMNREGFIEIINLKNNSDKEKIVKVLVHTVFHIQYYHKLCAIAGTVWEKGGIRFDFAKVKPEDKQDPAHDLSNFNKEHSALVISDQNKNNWVAVAGTNLIPLAYRLAEFQKNQVSEGKISPRINIKNEKSLLQEKPSCALEYQIKLPAGKNRKIYLVFASSLESEKEALKTYRKMQKNVEKLYEETTNHYIKFIENTALIETPDILLNKIFLWNKLTVEYLKQYTPGIGTGYHCSFSEWQNYFGRDVEFLLRGSIEAGDFEGARDQLEMYARFQLPSGEIFHELSPTGLSIISDADSTPLFVADIHHYLKWSGDISFAKKIYGNVERAIAFLESLDQKKNGLISTRGEHSCWGSGPTHPNEEQLVDQIYYYAALIGASELAALLGKNKQSKVWEEQARVLKEKRINSSKYYWSPEHQYFKKDIYGFEPKSLAIWPCMGILFNSFDEDKAKAVMDKLSSNEFNHDYGFLLVSRKRKDFSKMIWPWVSGIANICEFKMHSTDDALMHLSNMAKKVVMRFYPGSASDSVDANINETRGWPIFAWHVGCAILAPFIEGLFGVKPEIHKGDLMIDPHMPYNWQYMNLKNLKVGRYILDISFKRENNKAKIIVKNKTEDSILLKIGLNFPKNTNIKDVFKNTIDSEKEKIDFNIDITDKDLHIYSILEISSKSQKTISIILS
jgi:glycogen debranching enzyme